MSSNGPLAGVKIIEMVGIGPGPFVGMLLADMGADVIAIDRKHKSEVPQLKIDIHRRGKKSIILDLKSDSGKKIFMDLIEKSDAVFEGFRPGVMEKLDIGPDQCLKVNSSLVYGRMTGWGQDGPLAHYAGHDINYLSITGALHAMGAETNPPSPPLNIVGDYGAAMFLALGIVCGIFHSRNTGVGQVIDSSMVEGVNVLMSLFHSFNANGMWNKQREHNFLDGGAHYYRCYETSDGKYISLGAIERSFMKLFIELTDLDSEILAAHAQPELWPENVAKLEQVFKQKTQLEWCELLEKTDCCFSPVIPFWEAKNHFHNVARGSFVEVDGVSQPLPAPRFSKTTARKCSVPSRAGQHTQEILNQLGYDQNEIKKMFIDNVVS